MESTKLSEQKIAKDREENGISHCLSKVDSMDNNESGKFAGNDYFSPFLGEGLGF